MADTDEWTPKLNWQCDLLPKKVLPHDDESEKNFLLIGAWASKSALVMWMDVKDYV